MGPIQPFSTTETVLPGEADETKKVVLRDHAHLVVLTSGSIGTVYEIHGETVIGRDAQATVPIDAGDVSRRHARIRRVLPGKFVIEDLGSRNGTLINGLAIKKQQEQALNFGDKIRVGMNTLMIFTYRDPLEDQLVQSQKLDSLGKLAGGVAHDFGNLLGALDANISYLYDLSNQRPNVESGELRSCLVDMKKAVQQANALSLQLLTIARPSKDEPCSVDVSALVEEVVNLARRTFNQAIAIEATIAPELVVTGDRSRLHQVLMNLLINARDAMAEGGTVAVKVTEAYLDETAQDGQLVLSPGWYVMIEVKDTGTGMDEETCKRIFEPFFTTKERRRGTGLGLSIAHSIIMNHGGQIDVASEPGKGSIFRIYLPS